MSPLDRPKGDYRSARHEGASVTGSLRIANQGAVPSPCVDVCRIDEASGKCEGCLRTLDEIAAWGSLDDDGKRAVLRQLPLRRAQAAVDNPGAIRPKP